MRHRVAVANFGCQTHRAFCLTDLALEVQYAEFVHWLTGDEDIAEACTRVQQETTGNTEDP